MTDFQTAQQQVSEGNLKTPLVNANGKKIDYFGYQLSVHHFNLKLMAKGMTFKGITFTQLKKYYGLKGRSASDCLAQFETILQGYKDELNKPTIEELLA